MSKSGKGAAAAVAKFAPFDDSKLKPIHTAIDSGNYKNATKLLTAALQKHGPLPVLKILLALCHVQPGGAGLKEAQDLIRSLPPLAELDSTTFNTLLHYYKCMEDVSAVIRCHEHAVSRDPKNEDENLRLFFAMLRTHDYARLQTLSMKLFTSFKQDRYLCWSAVNLLLMRRSTQPNVAPAASSAVAASSAAPVPSAATSAPAPGADKMMVLLEMMLSRTYGAPSFARPMLPEELLVLVRVYSRQLKFTEALRLMDSEAGRAFKLKDATEYLRIRAQLLRDASEIDSSTPIAVQRLAESNKVYEELIAEHNDDWFFITQLIEGELKLGRTQQQQPSAAPSADASTAAASSADATVPAAVPYLSFEERSAKLRTFLRELQAKVTRSPSGGATSAAAPGQAFKRGPFLAEAELEFQLWRPVSPASKDAAAAVPAPSSAASTSALEQSVVSYFRQFGSKSCFFYDVLPYLSRMDHAARARIAQQCLSLIASLVGGEGAAAAVADSVAALSIADASPSPPPAAAGEAAQVKRFQLSASVQQMFRYNYSTVAPSAAARPAVASAGSASPTPSAASRDLESLGRSMLDQFLASTKLSTTLLRIQTERGVGDPFLVLFAHAYFSYFLAQQQQAAASGPAASGFEGKSHLLDLIMVFELGLSKFSVHNYQFKLWLIRLYCHPLIGAFARARDLYRSLDIKQIQHDSMSHLILDDALRFGHVLSDVLPSISKLLSWHATSDREDGSVTDLAYQKLNYSKVIEFVEFRERRENSFARYTAELLMPLAHLAKLGVPPSALGLPAPATPDPSNSKEIGNVHTLLTKARADLLKKYPAITDHSLQGSLDHLVLNNDFSVVSVWDVAHAPLPSMMNRPAPAVYPSSFQLPGGELLKPKDDGSYTHFASAAQQNQLRLLRLSIELLWGVTEQHAPLMRTNLHALQGVLQAMGLADITPTADSSSAATAAPTTPAFSSFDDAQWRLCFLLMDCSCCVVESAAHTSSFLESPAGSAGSPDHSDGVAQLCLRWSSVQRQFGILTFLLESITKDVSARFYTTSTQHASAAAAAAAAGASEDVRAVVYGLAAPDAASADSASAASSSIDPRALRDVATFVQWSASWLVVAVQMWAVAVPNKKSWKKSQAKQQSKGDKAAAAASAEESDPLLECVLSVRLSLASLIKTLRASIHAMQALANKLAARVRNAPSSASAAASSSSAATAAPSTLLDHKPSLLVLQSPEHSAIVHTVLSHIDSSHGHTGAQLLLLLNSLDQPLQHIKT